MGVTEAMARAGGVSVRTGITRVPSSSRGWLHKAGNDGFINLVEDADRGVLVGHRRGHRVRSDGVTAAGQGPSSWS